MRHPRIDFWEKSASLALGVRLEGSASGVARGGCVGRTYGDLTGGATRLAVVINTVLDVTANALDVIAAFLIVHFGTILLTAQRAQCFS